MTIDEETATTPTSTATKLAHTFTGMVQSFKPLHNIGVHLSGMHGYADEPRRQVIADHYCSHLTEDFRQCLIYDRNDTTHARLIGVEYVISRPMFEQLPNDEKRYWHSHAYEVESGLLTMPRAPSAVEKREMQSLADTYGKTWHFWQVDRGDPLPYGEPKLMCSLLHDNMVDKRVLAERDRRDGIDTNKNRQYRVDLVVPPPHPLADQMIKGKL